MKVLGVNFFLKHSVVWVCLYSLLHRELQKKVNSVRWYVTVVQRHTMVIKVGTNQKAVCNSY